MIWLTNLETNGGRKMAKGIDEILSNDLGEFCAEEDLKLIESFYFNIITSKIHQVYLNKHGRVPQNRFLGAILSKTNLSETHKSMIFDRVMYWLKSQNDMQWDEKIGMKRSRNFPTNTVKGLQNKCQWPGCENTESLQLDHKFPFSFGGESNTKNLQYLCQSCNLRKGSSIISINSWPTDE